MKGLVWRNKREGAHEGAVVGDAAGATLLEGGALCCPGGALGQAEKGALSGLPSHSDRAGLQKRERQSSEHDHFTQCEMKWAPTASCRKEVSLQWLQPCWETRAAGIQPMAQRRALLRDRQAWCLLVHAALCKGSADGVSVEQWSDPVHPANERPLWRDWEKGGNQPRLAGLWECVYNQGGKDHKRVVITNAVSGQLGTVTDAPRVPPAKLVGHPMCTIMG